MKYLSRMIYLTADEKKYNRAAEIYIYICGLIIAVIL